LGRKRWSELFGRGHRCGGAASRSGTGLVASRAVHGDRGCPFAFRTRSAIGGETAGTQQLVLEGPSPFDTCEVAWAPPRAPQPVDLRVGAPGWRPPYGASPTRVAQNRSLAASRPRLNSRVAMSLWLSSVAIAPGRERRKRAHTGPTVSIRPLLRYVGLAYWCPASVTVHHVVSLSRMLLWHLFSRTPSPTPGRQPPRVPRMSLVCPRPSGHRGDFRARLIALVAGVQRLATC